VVVKTGNLPAQGDPHRMVDLLGDQVLTQSVGMTKMRPALPPDDF
jgi:hypothetical protein